MNEYAKKIRFSPKATMSQLYSTFDYIFTNEFSPCTHICLMYMEFCFQNLGNSRENKNVDRLLLVSKMKKVQFWQNINQLWNNCLGWFIKNKFESFTRNLNKFVKNCKKNLWGTIDPFKCISIIYFRTTVISLQNLKSNVLKNKTFV